MNEWIAPIYLRSDLRNNVKTDTAFFVEEMTNTFQKNMHEMWSEIVVIYYICINNIFSLVSYTKGCAWICVWTWMYLRAKIILVILIRSISSSLFCLFVCLLVSSGDTCIRYVDSGVRRWCYAMMCYYNFMWLIVSFSQSLSLPRFLFLSRIQLRSSI